MIILSLKITAIFQYLLNLYLPEGAIEFWAILIISMVMFLGIIKHKKRTHQNPPGLIFSEFSQYFAREEIRSNLSKFEWEPIRKQIINKTVKEIDVVKNLKQLLKDNNVSVVILSGPGGCGKTKALYELARSQKKNRCVFARWGQENIEVEQLYDEFANLSNLTKYIILDDVDLDPNGAVQFCVNLMFGREKFILAARHGKELLNILKDYRISGVTLFQLNKMENIGDLLEFNSEDWFSSDIKEKLITISNGNPEVLSIAHEFIEQKIQQNSKLQADELLQEVTDKVSLFDTIAKNILGELDDATLGFIARVVILQGLDKSDPFCKRNFKIYFQLRSLNYFYIQYDMLFFKPAILGEYITRQYFFPIDLISPTFNRLVENATLKMLTTIISSLIVFNKDKELPVYKLAVKFMLSYIRNSQLDNNSKVRLALYCESGFRDSKLILDSISDFCELEINSNDPDLLNQFAMFCANNKAYPMAAKWWEKLLEIARDQQNDGWITASYNNLGTVYQNMGNWDNAIECFQLACDRFELMGMTGAMIQSLNNLAQVYQKQGDWKQGIKIYKKAVDELKKKGDIGGAARLFAIIAQLYQNNNEFEDAIENFNNAKDEFEKTGNAKALAQIYGNLGFIYKSRNNFDTAINCFHKTLTGLKKIKDSRGIAQTYNNLALVYQEKGDSAKAVSYYQQSIEKFEQINDSQSLAQALNNLALIYQYNEQWDKALKFHQRSLKINEKLGNNKDVVETLNNLGLVYQAKELWEEAIDCFHESINLKGKLGSVENIVQTYGNLGIVYNAKGQFDRAIKSYQIAITAMEKAGDIHGMAQTYGNLGVTYFDQKNYDKAISLLDEVLFFYLKQEAPQEVKQVSNVFINFQKGMEEKDFNKIADKALNNIVKNGIQWGQITVLSGEEAKDILIKLKEKKKKRENKTNRDVVDE